MTKKYVFKFAGAFKKIQCFIYFAKHDKEYTTYTNIK